MKANLPAVSKTHGKGKETEQQRPRCYECSAVTTTICVQCDQPYCDKCYNEYHRSKLFSVHNKIEIATSAFQLNHGFCKNHNNQRFKEFCKECQAHLCSDCVLQHNETHNLTSIEKMVSMCVFA